MIVAATGQPASAQRFLRSGLRGGGSVSNLQRHGRTVAPAVNRGRVTAKLRTNTGRVSAGQAANADRKLGFTNKMGKQQFNANGTLQTFRDQLQRPKIDATIKDRILAKDPLVIHPPDFVGPIIPFKPHAPPFYVPFPPDRLRPYPVFIPIPLRSRPVPVYIQGGNSSVVGSSQVQATQTAPEDPQKPDLAIILAHCPLPVVVAGQDLGPALQVAAACLSTERVDDVAIDVFLTTDPERVENGRQAKYSPLFSDGVLLKGGREVVSFPGNGLLNVPLKGAITIPADTPGGDYYLGVAIDTADKLEEADETNNVRFVPVRVIATGQPAP